ncbi:MAG: hypothetical protein EHM72_10810 [Calditrichaeota bacterium]|nr:MAG: hypothetical protein EHM72_10810 [Calditrichota bacterium]
MSAAVWTNAMLRYYSHEMAHEYLYRKSNALFNSGINIHRWTSSYVPGFYYPSWYKDPVVSNNYSDDQLLSAIAAGLNQDEWNARTLWREAIDLDQPYYESISFLMTKLRDVLYILSSGSNEKPFASGQNIESLTQTVYATSPQLFDDINLYRLALLNRGIELSNRSFLRQALFADLLTWKTWTSVYSIFYFLHYGTHPAKQDTKWQAPLVSFYLTHRGTFYNLEIPFKLPSDHLLLINIGSMKDGNSPFSRHVRFGAEYSPLRLHQRLTVMPFVFMNLNESDLGVLAGAQLNAQIIKHMQLTLLCEYHQHDMLENTIKGEEQGFHFEWGIRHKLTGK